MANVLNINVNIIESEEGPGLGGAMLAAVACGEYTSVQEAADKIVKVIGTEKPDANSIMSPPIRHDSSKTSTANQSRR